MASNSALVNLEALQALAQRLSEINETFKASIPKGLNDLTNTPKYQTKSEMDAAIAAAIAQTGHASFKKVDAKPDDGDAQENVLYLVYNEDASQYDIYALIDGKVEWLDDMNVDLSDYVKTETLTTKLAAKVDAVEGKGLSTNDFDAAAKSKLSGIAEGATKVEKGTENGTLKINGSEVQIYEEPEDLVHGQIATTQDVQQMLNEVFPQDGG